MTLVLVGEVSRAQQPPAAPPPESGGETRARPASEGLPDAEVPAYYFSPLRFSGRVLEDGQAADLTAEVLLGCLGPGVVAVIALLSSFGRLSQRMIASLLRDQFRLEVADGQISRLLSAVWLCRRVTTTS